MDYKEHSINNIVIRRALNDEWESAMEVCWRTFLKFEASEYPKEGTENFLDFISGQELYQMFLNGDYKVWLALDGSKIVGVGTLRAQSHISLLFVEEDYHRQGIGRRLVEAMYQSAKVLGHNKLTVNASPYGEEFYHKIGFLNSGERMQTDGIIYTPMILIENEGVK